MRLSAVIRIESRIRVIIICYIVELNKVYTTRTGDFQVRNQIDFFRVTHPLKRELLQIKREIYF